MLLKLVKYVGKSEELFPWKWRWMFYKDFVRGESLKEPLNNVIPAHKYFMAL